MIDENYDETYDETELILDDEFVIVSSDLILDYFRVYSAKSISADVSDLYRIVEVVPPTDDADAFFLETFSSVLSAFNRYSGYLSELPRCFAPDFVRSFMCNGSSFFVQRRNMTAVPLVDFVVPPDSESKPMSWLRLCDLFLPFLDSFTDGTLPAEFIEFLDLSLGNLCVNCTSDDETATLAVANAFSDEFLVSMNDFLYASKRDTASVNTASVTRICEAVCFCLTGLPFDRNAPELFFDACPFLHQSVKDALFDALDLSSFATVPSLYELTDALSAEHHDLYSFSLFESDKPCVLTFDLTRFIKKQRRFDKQIKKMHKKALKRYKRKCRLVSTCFSFLLLLFAVFVLPRFFGMDFIRLIYDANSAPSFSLTSDSDLFVPSPPLDTSLLIPAPDLVGKSFQYVCDSIKYENFTIYVVSEVYNDSVEAGDIISQTVDNKTLLAKNAPIGVVVSLGKETQSIPDISNLSVEQAFLTLKDVGFGIGNQIEIYNDSVREGFVIAPVDNLKSAPYGSLIDIWVSLGSKPVPTTTAIATTTTTTTATTTTTTTTTTTAIATTTTTTATSTTTGKPTVTTSTTTASTSKESKPISTTATENNGRASTTHHAFGKILQNNIEKY